MKAEEARGLSDEEIAVRLRDARDAIFNLRFQHAQGALERTSEISVRRREIARLLTIARQREIASAGEAR
ncbi:MAG TPA: 50S ribosomal protein L29 [Miltoncostaeaceae bacterium]|nr:50S ribosomal protein L29 [Miltoncostaeaceae bacterium]